jgi:glycosyltransferase involved in cell wall biosynthesis
MKPTTADARYQNETVAFWLQLEPYQQLMGEGIGQHLAHMLADWREARAGKAELLAPIWARPVVEEMFDSYDLPRDRIKARYFGPPIVATLLARRFRTKTREIENRDFTLAGQFADLPAPGLFALLVIPFAPLILLLYFIFRTIGGTGRAWAQRIAAASMRAVRAAAFGAMARHVNHSRAIDFCIVPIGNWTLCRLITAKPVVVQIPDIVFLEFPEFFDRNPEVNALANEIMKVARHAAAIVSPSEHVSRHHIRGFLGAAPERAVVALHAPMLLDRALSKLTGTSDLPSRAQARAELSRRWAWMMERPFYLNRLGGSLNWYARIRTLDLEGRRLVYFPTQYRPYKNIERAIEVIGRLKDRPGPPVTLLLTADLSGVPKVMKAIEEAGLLDRVIPLPRLPQPYHALVAAASDLVLAASRFEGGFPFLCGEALSVGTPVILADIPIVRATIPPNLRVRMAFDPLDVESMAGAIDRALRDDGLFLEQSRWFGAMRRTRRWANVLEDYLDAGRAAVTRPRPQPAVSTEEIEHV